MVIYRVTQKALSNISANNWVNFRLWRTAVSGNIQGGPAKVRPTYILLVTLFW